MVDVLGGEGGGDQGSPIVCDIIMSHNNEGTLPTLERMLHQELISSDV